MPRSAAISSVNGSLILEEPLIRTPYELLRRSHRSAQRQVEKDFVAVQTALNGLIKSLGPTSSLEEAQTTALSKLDQVSDRVKGLKRKLDDLQPSENVPTPLRSRLTYLSQLADDSAAVSKAKQGDEPVEVKKEADVKPDVDVEMRSTDSGGSVAAGQAAEGFATGGNLSPEAIKVEAAGEVRMITPPPETSDPPTEETDKTIDRYIVDYLLRTGRMKTAKALVAAQGLDALVDVKLFAELAKIETALMEKHSVAEALAWCGENRGTLRKTKNNLEFTLRMQEFTELCRKRDTAGAIAYSRKNLAPWATTHMPQLQHAMTMLVFGERTGVNLYKTLYDPSRWVKVRDSFRETFLALYALPSQPLLSLALSAGLASLRLPACTPSAPPTPSTPKAAMRPTLPTPPTASPSRFDSRSSGADLLYPLYTSPAEGVESPRARSRQPRAHSQPIPGIQPALPLAATALASADAISDAKPEEQAHAEHAPPGNVDCPTCGDAMRVLAKEVPMSHHVNSTIVCRISGEVMDSQNEPMAFPNGYVYSSKALAEMAKNNFDVVTCPRTGESCAFSRLRKVYIS